MRLAPDGSLLVGAVVSQRISSVDLTTGRVTAWATGPDAGADDLVHLPNGTTVWTAFMEGKVMARDAAGLQHVVAQGLPGVDAIGYRARDRRLFVSQCFVADALVEIDPEGKRPPRKILGDLGCLNGFDFGPDGLIYGPLWSRGTIVSIDPDTAKVTTIVSGLATPAAVKFGPDGRLFAINAGDGRVFSVDLATKRITDIARLGSGLDNLLPIPGNRLLVSSLTDNSIVSVDLAGGPTRTIVKGALAAPGGIALACANGRERLYVADMTRVDWIDLKSRARQEFGRDHAGAGARIISTTMVGADGTTLFLSGPGGVQWLDARSGRALGQMSGLSAPYGVVPLDDGTLAVAEYGAGRIARIDTIGMKLLSPIATGLRGPLGLTRAPGGGLFVSEREGGRLLRIDPATGAMRTIAAGLMQPEGIAVAPDGRIVVAEAGARRLSVIGPAGDATSRVILVENLPIGLPSQTYFPAPFLPTGVAVSGDGSVYVSSDIDRAIYRVRQGGVDLAGPRQARRSNNKQAFGDAQCTTPTKTS